jgi:hypothetical protein
MTVKLTDRFLTSRKAPLVGRAIYTDSVVPGLTFRVSAATASNPEGRRDWLLRYRPRRQKQRAIALGTYPAISLAKARERAGEIIGAAKCGIDLIAADGSTKVMQGPWLLELGPPVQCEAARKRCLGSIPDYDRRVSLYEFRHQIRQVFIITAGKVVFNRHILPIDIASFFETQFERRYKGRCCAGCCA